MSLLCMSLPPDLHFFLVLLRALSVPCIPFSFFFFFCHSVDVAGGGYRAGFGSALRTSSAGNEHSDDTEPMLWSGLG